MTTDVCFIWHVGLPTVHAWPFGSKCFVIASGAGPALIGLGAVKAVHAVQTKHGTRKNAPFLVYEYIYECTVLHHDERQDSKYVRLCEKLRWKYR